MAPHHSRTPSPATHNHPRAAPTGQPAGGEDQTGRTLPAGTPRPRHRYRPTNGPLVVRHPGFVAMSEADEGRALEALAELLAPLFATPPAAAIDAPSEPQDSTRSRTRRVLALQRAAMLYSPGKRRA